MTTERSSFSVSADVANPGQFFACCGLLELAHRLWPSVEGWFTDEVFNLRLSPAIDYDGVEYVLETLAGCSIRSDRPQVSTSSKKRRGGDPEKIASVHLESPYGFRLDWWTNNGEASVLKLWSGNQSPQDIITKLQKAIPSYCDHTVSLMDRTAPMKGRFGIDPRSAWESLDVGFSPHAQDMQVATYPGVELLGAVGLQRFRPLADKGAEGRVVFRYATWGVPLPAPVGAAVCTGLVRAAMPRRFEFRLAHRGKYKGFDWAIALGDER